ncbi:Phenylpyruvate tautomerase PptA, 4-oxalocrotonate tautomerase family [Natronincola peptidivorans]|uniref:Phenylpyruvate tautomerase PptA, 4-oxalocrotonate tautomerase family n=1 Tax=Natronincola peptidivorans TaxID=426128 RepID=A0A1I0DFL0_9FIRM|nr:tautomerase family protein [Natronincola peptidivorans]SET30559.1 Phenylpyruvate tautomerase PptA, 4-oxalocrotonate tautomerase family [Natronincola peptidivorans]
MNPIKKDLLDVIHLCVVEVFEYPEDKRFHRFFPMKEEDFYFQSDRSENYTIIEISIFEGRKKETKKKLLRLLFERIEKELHIAPKDIEITIFETPACNWGIRGVTGDELTLNYKADV